MVMLRTQIASDTIRMTSEEVFERANNTPYGLSAGVWTDTAFARLSATSLGGGVCGIGPAAR
jgi:acyl-CoA reductase-like NAD-dependent aldehyde dehydrogenase